MAHVTTPFPISGTFGALEFFQANGKTFIRQRRTFNKKKWLRQTNGARRAAESFGGASAVSNAIYRTIKAKLSKAHFPNYTTNKITAKLQNQAYRRQHNTEQYTIQQAAALLNLELGHQQQSRIEFKNFGPNHNPEYTHIKGLQAKAQQLDTSGTKALQCKIQQICISFPEVNYDNEARKWRRKDAHDTKARATIYHQHSTNWIDQDLLDKKGLRLSLHQESTTNSNKQENCLTFFIIQWRTAAGELTNQTTIKCTAIHQAKPDQSKPKKHNKKQRPSKHTENRPEVRLTKAARKAQALNGWPKPKPRAFGLKPVQNT